MKTCHACGQKLPLKVGEIVEFNQSESSRFHTQPGVVTFVDDGRASILGLRDGLVHSRKITGLVRCHGYYRITEREAL